MKRDLMPVTPAVMRWAREQAGIPLADAQVAFGDIEGWESGSSRPTYCELEKLADQYQVPIAVFFFPEPPDTVPITRSLRTMPSDRINCLPSRARLLIRRAKALQLDIEELYQAQGTKRRSMLMDLPFCINTPVHQMARAVRDYLGVSIADQFQWRDPLHALNEWRSAFFRSGVFVMTDQFPDGEFNGFCLHDKLTPLIYVNTSFTYECQILILFCVLATLLFETSGLDLKDNERSFDQETIPMTGSTQQVHQLDESCFDFASEALVPSIEFEKCLGDIQATEQSATTLASRFHVSPELFFRRFRNRDLVSEATYRSATTRWNSQHKIERVPTDLSEKTISFFGRDYVGLALSTHYAGLVNEEQLAKYLNVKVGDLEALESFYEQRTN